MVDNLHEQMYPKGDDSGAITAPPSPTQFKDLYNLVTQRIPKVDGDQTKPLTPRKHHNILSLPADAISGWERGQVRHACIR
jgi:hypothetical protein